MSSAVRPSKTESRIDYEVNQASHGFSVGTILTHTGSAYAAAINTDEIVGVVSEVDDTNNFTIQTHGRITGLSSLSAGTQYYVSDSSAGDATSSDTDTAIYVAISATDAILNNYVEGAAGSGGGDLTLLSTATASNSTSIDFTVDMSSYESLLLIATDVESTGSDTALWVRTSSDTGSTFDSGASDYVYGGYGTFANGSNLIFNSGGSGTTRIALNYNGSSGGFSSTSTDTGFIRIDISGHNNTSGPTHLVAQASIKNVAGNVTSSTMGGFRKEDAIVDGIRLVLSSGNIRSGTFKLYGRN